MKRRGVYPYHFLFLITFLIGTLFHGIAEPACSGFTQDAEENLTDYDHIPNASVEVLPAYYSDSPADHTYIKAMRKNGSCTAWPCFWPLQKYCHVNCLDSAGQWPLPKTTQDPKAVKESPPHPEVAIYRKYLPEARQAKSRQAYQAVYQSYIDELLEYHIADRLGRDWSRKTSGVSFRYQRVGGWNKKGRAS